MTPLPNGPWKELSIDFFGPLPSGDYLFVIIDEYSRYPVVEIIRSTSALTVIPMLDKVLSMFGVPDIIKSDNGPPFKSERFHEYVEYMGIKHRRVTPYWPKANGEAERFMKNMNKVVVNQSWKQELYQFLRNYRATPHRTTGLSPYSLLMNRDMKVKLPEKSSSTQCDDELLRERDKRSKHKMKTYADSINNAKKTNLTEGDTVLVRQPKINKQTSKFDPKPYCIIQKKGSMITAKRDDHKITRNSSYFKLVPHTLNLYSEPHSDEDDEYIHTPLQYEPPPMQNDGQPEPAAAIMHSPPRRDRRERKRPLYLDDYVNK